MPGETDLQKLLAGLRPQLHQGEYVFVTVNDTSEIDRKDILGEFREEEGITLVLPRNIADAQRLSYDFVAARITLRVHSSLQAVGLTAVVSTELAKHGISCNIIAAYHHDHLFVNVQDAERAMQALMEISGQE